MNIANNSARLAATSGGDIKAWYNLAHNIKELLEAGLKLFSTEKTLYDELLAERVSLQKALDDLENAKE